MLRVASYNVENLFARAKALNLSSWRAGRPLLEAHAKLNSLFNEATYTAETKQRILELLHTLGLVRTDESEFVRLRKIRGQLVRRPRTGGAEVVASGRSDWIGWVELKTEEVDELAMRHTAMVIRDVNADVLGVVESDSRPALHMFSDALLRQVGGTPYPQVMVIDGNDPRGIDVGVLVRGTFPIIQIRTHVFDTDDRGAVFSRDCCEYHLATPAGGRLVVVMNHFKSKGYGDASDPIGSTRRARQATRVADIYRGLRAEGIEQVVVAGDLNDSPDSAALQPLLSGTDLRDISAHPRFDFGPRKGTYGSGNERDKIDYLLLSPALYAKSTGGAVFRKGVWRGARTKNPWPIYDTLTAKVHEGSDHAAIYADIDL